MRRKAILACLLLSMMMPAIHASISYQPDMTISGGGTFTCKPNDIPRSSYSIRVDLNPVAVGFGNNCIAFPISYTYVSRTPYYQGYCLNSHMDFGVGISYRYLFSDMFSLEAATDVQLRFIYENHGGIFAMDVILEPALHLGSCLKVGLPVGLGLSKNEFNISTSLAITYMPLGGK